MGTISTLSTLMFWDFENVTHIGRVDHLRDSYDYDTYWHNFLEKREQQRKFEAKQLAKRERAAHNERVARAYKINKSETPS